MKIEGKAAVVTGASRGVGRATALALARCGCHVMLNHRDSAAEAEAAAADARALGVDAIAYQADIADDDACRSMFAAALERFGRLDVLINNAGTTRFIPHSRLDEVSAEDWHRLMTVNVVGPFQCVRAALPYLKKSGNAEIINVASIAGLASPGSSIPYGASKAALINMTADLARVLGPDHIRVNAVAPGFIEGSWLRKGLGERFDELKKLTEQASALGRVCQPEDVADAILSLVTGSDQVTGQTLVVDGGKRVGPRVS